MADKPSASEQYAVAINTSNLRVQMDADRRSNADVLMAAAWSPQRIGSSLLRLHSEYTGYDTGHASTEDAFLKLVARLRTLPEVRYQLELLADKWGCDNAKHVAFSVIMWWLDKQCKTCNGTKYQVIQGTGRQSANVCRTCHGSGESPIPCGDHGKRMAGYIDDCMSRARQSIKSRLRPKIPLQGGRL